MLLTEATENLLKYLELIDRSKDTINGYRLEMKYFNNYLTVKHNGPVYMDDIKLEDLEDYLLDQKERGLSSSSRSRSLYVLRSFYNYCCKKEICQKNLALLLEPVKVKQKERDYITEDEFAELIGVIKQPVIKTVVQTMFYTGGRVSEIITLRLDDVDMKKKIIYIINGKGGKDRKIPINDKLHEILKYYLEEIRENDIESDRFFAMERTGKVSRSYVNRLLKEAAEDLNWEKNISSHNLRHSFGTNLLDKGASLVSIQKLMGHASLTVTSRYLHQDMTQLSETVNLL